MKLAGRPKSTNRDFPDQHKSPASPPFEPLTPRQTQAYINYLRMPYEPYGPDLFTLNALITAHVERVPFENLDQLLVRDVDLDADVVFSKVVEHGRGGFCFELNSLFGRLLLALGYRLQLRLARVRTGGPATTPPLATMDQHLVLLVLLQEGTFLVDVAFLVQVPHAVSTASSTVDADFAQLRPLGDSGVLELSVPNSRVGRFVLYHVEPRPIAWIDCAPICWYLTTHPESELCTKLMVARSEGDAWMTLNNGRFTIRRNGKVVRAYNFHDADLLLDMLQDEFAIHLCPRADMLQVWRRLQALVG
ncbi:arylamine N-acetyltransferase-like [Haemaphysalis longicornis]